MRKIRNLGGLSLCLLYVAALGASPPPVAPSPGASWPAKVFAPYAYITPRSLNITNCLRETGQRYYTLSFVISDADGEPAWDGSKEQRTRSGYYAREINELRAQGGDVLISFGGEAGIELAINTPAVPELETKYQSVIDQYRLTWMDFDIEGGALRNTEANRRRNAVLKLLQSKNPGLKISFTVPVNPGGLESESIALLKDARDQGLALESVNIMTMDYGAARSGGKKMGALAIAAAKATCAQLQALDPALKIGLTPMIGQNDVKEEIFSLDDARAVLDFANQTPWIRSVSFWSISRDRPGPDGKGGNRGSGVEQQKWDFTNIFKDLH